ncbi:uncharacterized protein NESG_01898 [Nematocida ausubeli]|uniref:Uncharacterized protein n=1 Tax=Nematocida ausubeli (strain ATCC PRA-371 / ERTm2) TaxID=1913371 RepID=A0A086J191_NEMA1|nr:uncharacterized protein NESG_01898 [Nematocida ausubeli]KAI5132692.1 hypothetical protein NEAUS06_0288 [Nematocida ausubeli]KAI5137608.1 hypothetical protein NEAUS07_2056 [Nematocida ausubeli]KAI5147518.1 hypothetical protein NEAUS05_0818 [Nematocida ausubeli]KFG25909.1 hypothetical protein NESG_01898 [Nematocida ausubeli]
MINEKGKEIRMETLIQKYFRKSALDLSHGMVFYSLGKPGSTLTMVLFQLYIPLTVLFLLLILFQLTLYSVAIRNSFVNLNRDNLTHILDGVGAFLSVGMLCSALKEPVLDIFQTRHICQNIPTSNFIKSIILRIFKVAMIVPCVYIASSISMEIISTYPLQLDKYARTLLCIVVGISGIELLSILRTILPYLNSPAGDKEKRIYTVAHFLYACFIISFLGVVVYTMRADIYNYKMILNTAAPKGLKIGLHTKA